MTAVGSGGGPCGTVGRFREALPGGANPVTALAGRGSAGGFGDGFQDGVRSGSPVAGGPGMGFAAER
ncbi:hypothetical protein B5G16_03560 [Alistipes sp. An66]|nr:hypothetical protein B5G16_03560 [Alistipes sp. An66]